MAIGVFLRLERDDLNLIVVESSLNFGTELLRAIARILVLDQFWVDNEALLVGVLISEFWTGVQFQAKGFVTQAFLLSVQTSLDTTSLLNEQELCCK